jgi:hypothetical protein
MSDKKNINWSARFLKLLIFLCVLGAGGVFAAKLWVLPSMVRSETKAYLQGVWAGDIEIADVELNVFSPSYVRGVEIRDDFGRLWLSVPEIRIEAQWEDFVPHLKVVRVQTAKIHPQFVDGQCTVPVKRTESAGDGPDLAEIIGDLKDIELTIGYIEFSAVNNISEAQHIPGGVDLPGRLSPVISRASAIFKDIVWRGGKFSVAESSGRIGDDPISISLSGGLQDDKSVTLGGEVRGPINENFLGATFNFGLERGGVRRFEVSFAGRIRGAVSGNMQPDGTVSARADFSTSEIKPDQFEWLIGSNKNAALAVAGADVKVHVEATGKPGDPIAVSGGVGLTGPVGQFDAKIRGQFGDKGLQWGDADIAGEGCGGTLRAKLKIDRIGDRPMRFTLEAVTHQIRMSELTRVFSPDKIMKDGVLAGEISMAMPLWDTGQIKGKGAFLLDDIDPLKVPIISDLFRHLDIKLSSADVHARFDLKGPKASILTGQLGSVIWAANAEPGGTIDLETEKIDMYVLFLPIKQAGPVLSILDAVNPLKLIAREDPVKKLIKSMIRRHVGGTISKPVITSAVITDLSKAPADALGFFKDVAAGAGQIGQGVIKAIINGGK